MNFYPFRYWTIAAYGPVAGTDESSLKARLHDRAKMARARQKLERFEQFLQRNSELLSVSRRVQRRLWTRRGTDKSSLFLCKNCCNRSSFYRARAIFSLSCKRAYISLQKWMEPFHFVTDPCHFSSVVLTRLLLHSEMFRASCIATMSPKHCEISCTKHFTM